MNYTGKQIKRVVRKLGLVIVEGKNTPGYTILRGDM